MSDVERILRMLHDLNFIHLYVGDEPNYRPIDMLGNWLDTKVVSWNGYPIWIARKE